MEVGLFLRGIVIGFSIAAPVGPIGVLCIQRSLNQGPIYGFVSGLGAATADGCYGIIAAVALTTALSILSEVHVWFSLIGGLYLIFLGIRAFRTLPPTHHTEATSSNWINCYLSAYILTLTNPMTILSFAAIFAGFGLTKTTASYLSAGLLVSGVFLGSASWWLFLSSASGLIRAKFRPGHLRWVNRVSGAIITGFGLYVLTNVKL